MSNENKSQIGANRKFIFFVCIFHVALGGSLILSHAQDYIFDCLLISLGIGFLISLTQAKCQRTMIGMSILLGSAISLLVYIPIFFLCFFRLGFVC